MALKSIFFAGATAFTLLAGAAPANAAPYYSCNGGWCYDDQAEETRELNLRQLYNPGAGVHAVPGYDDRYGDDEDQAHMDHGRHHPHHGYGYRDRDGGADGSGAYGPRDDRDDGYGQPNDDDDQYGDDDQNDDGAYDDDNDDDR